MAKKQKKVKTVIEPTTSSKPSSCITMSLINGNTIVVEGNIANEAEFILLYAKAFMQGALEFQKQNPLLTAEVCLAQFNRVAETLLEIADAH